jgi:hypothetical protein
MRYFDGFSRDANLCDIYAANDSEIVRMLEWITSEEQLGVTLREQRERAEEMQRGEAQESMWELTDVQHREMETHSLELFPEYAKLTPQKPVKPQDDPRNQQPHALDISRQEHDLRQECAALASRLAYILKSAGRATEISLIHAEAKRQLSKAQEELSIVELRRKRAWLMRCIDARKVLAG